MRALLTPEIAPRMGVVLLRPGADLMPMFRRGRVLIEPAPEKYSDYATGAIPPATQPLAGDPVLKPVFENKDVILRAGGISSLEAELERRFECQYPHGSWHSENFTLFRHEPGSIRLCWACDNLVRDQYTETLARKALRLPEIKHQPVMKESDIVPEPAASEVVQKKILGLRIDPETPESFMLRPKRRRWVNESWTRWVKSQQCVCCNKQADDPHHLIGHGQGGMGTKAHDLFVLPLCRAHHDELHADTVAFEEKHGSQLELLFRFLDRSLAIGVLA